ncbi:hypothetical protein, partial [Klebsiella aerogenes]|uniref:hypothetical protein n=1 Tax=Klebsiella aerogenes TaxID=548 RepID=UPI00195494A1
MGQKTPAWVDVDLSTALQKRHKNEIGPITRAANSRSGESRTGLQQGGTLSAKRPISLQNERAGQATQPPVDDDDR